MALGTLGSTLNDELNRLANGGTYRDMNQMVDEALAAKQWANRENIIPYSTDTVGILNEIAGLGLDKKNWLDFNGVCNYIAGTTGLPAAAALRQVYPTTDLLTSQASYYVDGYAGTNYIPTTASGYLYLPGLAGNGVSTPDANALDITGDIDIRAKIAPDNWIPSTAMRIINKIQTGPNSGYALELATNGTLVLYWANGGSFLSTTSTAIPSVLDGSTLWVRATLDVDNGASGNTTTFFTSTDGVNWTQLGNTVVQAGTTSITANTAQLRVGITSENTFFYRGKIFRAQVLNGIAGTTVFDANFETAMTAQTVTSFTESSSNAATVTVFRTTYDFPLNTISNLGAAGSLLPTTVGSSTAADSNDPKFLDHTGTNYVYLPGVVGNYLSVPDAAALDITGDIDLRGYLTQDLWTGKAANGTVISKFNTTGNQRSYELNTMFDGTLRLIWSADGTNIIVKSSTAAVPFVAGQAGWVRATLDVDNGAGGNDVKFFTSTDGTTWTQLGSTVTTAGVTSIFSGTANVEIGTDSTGTANFTGPGKYLRAQIFNGIDGTKVLDVDTSVITAGSATSFTAVTGQTVTINRSTSGRKTVAVTQPTWLFGTDDYMEVNNRYMSSGTYLYLPGIASNFASTPDAAALDITGDIDIRVKVALDDWTPSAQTALLAKDVVSGGQRSYNLGVNTSGQLTFVWTTNGSTVIQRFSDQLVITDGTTKWVRVTLDVDNGASGYDLRFFTSDDGNTWTQLGATQTVAGVTSIFAGTAPLEVGSQASGQSPARGKFFRAQVLNGINGTVAFDANFETSITSLNQTSFTESSTNAATVTINRSGSTYRSAGITAAGYLYPGATNTFSASATNFLDFGAADSFTVLAVIRQWATPGNFQAYVMKGGNLATGNSGYLLFNNATNSSLDMIVTDGVNQTGPTALAYTLGSLNILGSSRNVAADTISNLVNTSRNNATDPTTGSLSTYHPFTIGKNSNAASGYATIELTAAAVFRSALTASQIRQIFNYFANREVYL
jgi:hypothetical protein